MAEYVEKHPVFQGLMTAAYNRYNANKPEQWTKDAIINQAKGFEIFAVPLGNMNYQIENGGFSQWIGNQYATPLAINLIHAALMIIGTEASAKVHALLKRANSVGLEEPNGDDEEWEMWGASMSKFSREYYDINEQLMDDAEAFFVKHSAVETVS